jgi:hypothetical protein
MRASSFVTDGSSNTPATCRRAGSSNHRTDYRAPEYGLLMSRWENVRPILVKVYDLMEQWPEGYADGDAVADALGIEDDDYGDDLTRLLRDLQNLHEAGYIDCQFDKGRNFNNSLPLVIEGTEKGRQEVLGWPGPRTSTASAELLVNLLRAAANAPDTPPEQKTTLRAILKAIGKGGTDALSKVTAELILRGGSQIV